MSTNEGIEPRYAMGPRPSARVVISVHVRRTAEFTAQQAVPEQAPDEPATWLELQCGDGDVINLFGPSDRLRILMRGGIEALDRLEGAREGTNGKGGTS